MEGKRRRFSRKVEVSIIILSPGDAGVTLECLDAIFRHTSGVSFEVLLVDNGSPPAERTRIRRGLRRSWQPLSLIRFPENLGFARANNLVAAKAQGEILVFLNNDAIVTAGWLLPLITFLESHPEAVACQPKLRSFVAKDYFDYTGGAGGFLDLFGYPFTRGRVFDSIEKDSGQYDLPVEITWASGSCFAILATAFWEMGGFDEYFFAYFEEIDLCVRLREKGYGIFCVPDSLVYHYGAYTSNKNLSRKIYMNHRNNLYFFLKHYSFWPYFPLFVCRVVFDIGSIVYYLFKGRFSFVLSVGVAYLALLWHFPVFVKRRVLSLCGKALLSDPTLYRGSVVLAYFLFRRRNFDAVMGKRVSGSRVYKRYDQVTFFQKR